MSEARPSSFRSPGALGASSSWAGSDDESGV
eukprot:CAMPEP_0204190634 /NCGR_PEP_ID=MMETSP0361-20130328/59465_1 /ASSEMBLY_ACC=CAM_ASM_000343 /TAXON_ID=268821 /ORGANISM="Scrippsiella Hangoei, Strain SHTV-5" /LENGTH=30 /DNA_ID= /DNA_START= /DNA_END= /DNA_ORIENTATION=